MATTTKRRLLDLTPRYYTATISHPTLLTSHHPIFLPCYLPSLSNTTTELINPHSQPSFPFPFPPPLPSLPSLLSQRPIGSRMAGAGQRALGTQLLLDGRQRR